MLHLRNSAKASKVTKSPWGRRGAGRPPTPFNQSHRWSAGAAPRLPMESGPMEPKLHGPVEKWRLG